MNTRSRPLTASSVSNTSAAAYAREMFTPSKDSWSHVDQTENKSFWALVWGFDGCR